MSVGSILFASATGSVALTWHEWLAAIADPGSRHGELIWQLRMPRAVAAWVVGSLLAMSGCLMQVLLRNPLADPYVLGVSGGAAFATLLGMVFGVALGVLPWLAILGALFSILIVFGLARGTGPWSGTRLLLTGVVTASGWAALISLVLSLSPDASLRGMLFWLMGDLSYAAMPAWSFVVLGGSFVLCMGLARSLNVLAMGETTARLLGEPTRQMLWLVYLLASLLLRILNDTRKLSLGENHVRLAAVSIAALWLLHPLNLTPVLYIVQRMTGLSALFVLGALLLYVTGRLRFFQGKNGIWPILLAFPVAGLGMLAKENAALFPLLLLVLELTLLRGLGFRESRTTVIAVWGMGIAMPLVLGLGYLLTHPELLNYFTRPFTLEERLLTQSRVLWLYVQLFAIPTTETLGFMHDAFVVSRGLFSPPSTLPAAVSWLVILLASLLLAKRFPVFAFTGLFFLGAHALESSIFPLEMIYEHRNYLATFGLAFGLVYLLSIHFRALPHSRYFPVLLVLLIAAYASVTHLRAWDWSDDATFVLTEVEHHPDSLRANFRAAQLYTGLVSSRGDSTIAYTAARGHFEKILQLDPNQPNALFGLLVLNLHIGRQPEPAWTEALENELRHGNVGPTRLTISQFSYLVRWQMRSPYKLEHATLLRLFESALDNRDLTPKGRASILSARRAYYDNVLNQPYKALEDAREAARTWPARWHYQKRLAELTLRLSLPEESEKVLTRALARGLPENQAAEAQKLLQLAQEAKKQPSHE